MQDRMIASAHEVSSHAGASTKDENGEHSARFIHAPKVGAAVSRFLHYARRGHYALNQRVRLR